MGLPWKAQDPIVHHNPIPGWWFEPLWKILVSWDDDSIYLEKKGSKPPTGIQIAMDEGANSAIFIYTMATNWLLTQLLSSSSPKYCPLISLNKIKYTEE